MIEINQITDLDTLINWRKEVIRNVFGTQADESLINANRNYYSRHTADDNHLAFVASISGKECGCGAICLTEELPSPDNPSGRCAYLMNIYVRESFRNKGVAHYIVSHLIDEAKRYGCGKIYLETTSEGRKLYSSLGFKDMPDMMKYYEQ